MNTTVTYKDGNGKKVTRIFTSPDDLVNRLSVEVKELNLKRKATKSLEERYRLIRAEIGLLKIIKHYSPDDENRNRKHYSYETR